MQFQAPTSDYNGYKYYLATKSFDRQHWHFTNKPFLLTISDSHVVGQFITTMWYNQLCEGESWECEVAVIRVAVNAKPVEFQAIKSIMNGLSSLNNGYDSYEGVVMYGVLNPDKYRDGRSRLIEKLDTQNVGGSACVNCELKMTTAGLINMTLQGAYNENKCVTTLTLPVFQIPRGCL